MNEAIRKQVLDLMNRHGIGLLEYEGPDGSLRLDAERSVQDHPEVLAPAPGRFLWRHPAERTDPNWPRHVRLGETIGWMKAGPMLTPIVASADGILRRPRLEHGSLAGYGERLF